MPRTVVSAAIRIAGAVAIARAVARADALALTLALALTRPRAVSPAGTRALSARRNSVVNLAVRDGAQLAHGHVPRLLKRKAGISLLRCENRLVFAE